MNNVTQLFLGHQRQTVEQICTMLQFNFRARNFKGIIQCVQAKAGHDMQLGRGRVYLGDPETYKFRFMSSKGAQIPCCTPMEWPSAESPWYRGLP
jgi:hypothetical protein